MKVLLNLGDPHLKYEPYYNYGLGRFIEWFDRTFPDKARDITEIFLAGDTLDKVTGTSSQEANAYPFISVLKKKAKYIYAIMGNHDYGIKALNIISNKEFLESLGITVISENCEFETKLGFKVLCLPWHPSYSYDTENAFLDLHQHDNYDCIVSHWEYKPLFTDNFVDVTRVNSIAYAVGHVHTQGNAYIGSLLPNSAAEQKTRTAFSVVRGIYEKEGILKVCDTLIPSCVNIEEITLHSHLELGRLRSAIDTFYKIRYDKAALDKASILSWCKDNNINVYKEPEAISKSFEEFSIDTAELKLPEFSQGVSKASIIKTCKDDLSITEEEESKLLHLVNQN